MDIFKKIGLSLISGLLTETFIKNLIIFLLKKLAVKTDNKVDDKIIEMIESALK